MKHIYSFLFALLLGTAAVAQPANANMESWIKYALFEHPVLFITSSSSNYDTFFEDGSLNMTSVERQDEGKALRMANMQVNGETLPGYFIAGSEPEVDDGTLLFPGGFDFESADVTGLQLDLRHSFPADKPGMILMQFKSEGQPIGNGNHGTGTWLFHLEGDQSEWTTQTFMLEEPLGATPDQVVLAFASADLLGDDQPFAESSFLEIDNLMWLGADDEIPGGHLNSWAQVKPVFVPANSVVDVHPDHRNYFEAADAKEGALALGIETDDTPHAGDVGWVRFGATEDGDEILPTIHLDPNLDLMSFWYKYTADNDVAEAIVRFYKSSNLSAGAVYTKVLDLDPVSEYTLVEFGYADELTLAGVEADMMDIEFRSSKDNGITTPQVGSTLLIDDFKITGVSAVLAPVGMLSAGNSIVNCYPNPTMGRAIFDFDYPAQGSYRIYSSTGAMLSSHQYGPTSLLVHDLSNLQDGVYIFRFIHGKESVTVRVTKY